MDKVYYIYLTTNKINNKKYIGQHYGYYNDNYYGSGTTILKALKKYGKENFSKAILCTCATREEADEKEKYYIQKYNAVDSREFYNNAEGGSGADGGRSYRRGCEANPEQAQKIGQQSGERLKEGTRTHPIENQKNIQKMLDAAHQWQKDNPDKVMEIMKKVNQGKEKGQKEHPEEHAAQVAAFIKAGSEANSQKIICVTTGEIFPSQSEAARQMGIPQGNISKCLRGERKSAGKHPKTGEKLIWRKYEDLDSSV